MPVRYLRKPENSSLLGSALTYERPSDRTAIRAILIREQRGFCAYSERYFEPTDSAHIEHFDPRLKGRNEDSQTNWYAVHAFMNLNKPKAKSIAKFEPMLAPQGPEVASRIKYEGSLFEPRDPTDTEAQNLIEYLGVNLPEVVDHRQKHVRRIRHTLSLFEGDRDAWLNHLREFPINLSFASALEAELDINVESLLASPHAATKTLPPEE